MLGRINYDKLKMSNYQMAEKKFPTLKIIGAQVYGWIESIVTKSHIANECILANPF